MNGKRPTMIIFNKKNSLIACTFTGHKFPSNYMKGKKESQVKI